MKHISGRLSSWRKKPAFPCRGSRLFTRCCTMQTLPTRTEHNNPRRLQTRKLNPACLLDPALLPQEATQDPGQCQAPCAMVCDQHLDLEHLPRRADHHRLTAGDPQWVVILRG